MTVRWPLVGSLAALIAGAGLAALVLAFCGEGEAGSSASRSATRTAVSRTVTVTRTPRGGTPVATSTPSRTPSAARTPTPSGGVPAEETPEATQPPGPGETGTPGPEPTLPPGETPPVPSLTPVGTPTPVGPTSTPRPTATPTLPPLLPDLVVLDMSVSNDVIRVVVGNQGEGTLPAGQEVEFRVRGVIAETATLAQALPPGTSRSIVLEDQVIYKSELLLVVVDPNNLIAEENNNNNGLAKKLSPDVALDLAVNGVYRAPDTSQLLVVIRNPTTAPAVQVMVKVSVYREGATEPTAVSTYQLSIEPQGFFTVQVAGIAALSGVTLRVVLEMTDPPDADPSNNVWQGTLS